MYPPHALHGLPILRRMVRRSCFLLYHVPELVDGLSVNAVARWDELQLVTKVGDLCLEQFQLIVYNSGKLFAYGQ